MTNDAQNTPARQIPLPVQRAREALEILKGENAAEAEQFQKILPAVAMRFSKEGKDVTVESLLTYARQGIGNLPETESKQKPLTYAEVVTGFKKPAKTQDENEEDEDAPISKEALKRHPLFTAALKGDITAMRAQLDKGVSVNTEDEYRFTALMVAAGEGHMEAVQLLLSHGADVNKKNNGDVSALHIAITNDHVKMARLLLEHGANINQKSCFGEALLIQAIHNNQSQIVRLLLDHGADANEKLSPNNMAFAPKGKRAVCGETALWLAIMNGHTEIIELLLNHGASVQQEDVRGNTPLMCAVRYSNPEIIRLLLKGGAHVNQAGANGETALMHAARLDRVEIAQLLLDCGADIHQKDSSGKTAMSHAFEKPDTETYSFGYCHTRIVHLLHEHGISLQPFRTFAKTHKKESLEQYQRYAQKYDLWKKVARHMPPQYIGEENPAYFRAETFKTVEKMLAAEGYRRNDAASAIAFAASALFGTEQRVLQYLAKWGEAGKQPLHDIIHFIKAPKNTGADIKAWGDAVLKCGPSMARLFSFADRLPQPEKSADGRTWSYLRTREKVSQFAYERAKENPALAALCFENLLEEDDFNKALDLTKKQKKNLVKNLPEITISGESFDMEGATFHRLPANDVRGLLLGELTDCCQSIGGVGAVCAEHGFMSENGGFYVVETSKQEIIGQTWAWRGKEGELVFDSLETLGDRISDKQWIKLTKAFAVALTKTPGNVTALNIGTGGATPMAFTAKFKKAAASPLDYDSYRDSREQVSVWKASKPRNP